MEIGIIGKGKMGTDMLLYFLNYNCKLVLICRTAKDIEAINSNMKQ